jgi:hypothetical protein
MKPKSKTDAQAYLELKNALVELEHRLEEIRTRLIKKGPHQEGPLFVDVSVVSRETISIGRLEQALPKMVRNLRKKRLIQKIQYPVVKILKTRGPHELQKTSRF